MTAQWRAGDRTSDVAQAGFHLLDITRDRGDEAPREGFRTTPGDSTSDADSRNGDGERAALPPLSDIAVPWWMRAPTPSAMPAVSAIGPDCIAVLYRPSGFLPFDIEARRRVTYDAMSAAACQAGIPVGLFDALILSESAYDSKAVSPKRAYGLTQLMPGTASALGVDRFNPIQNLRGGARYLRAQLDTFGQPHLALAAYNAGPGRVRAGRIPPIAETQEYVRNVLTKWIRLAGQQPIGPATSSGLAASPSPVFAPAVRTTVVHLF